MAKHEQSNPFGAAFESFGALPQQYGNALVMLSQACQGYIDGAARLNQEVAQFARVRLDKDVDYGQALSSCRSLEDVASLQQGWAQALAEDYMAETTKLYEICVDAASNGWTHTNGAGSAPAKKAAKAAESK